MKKEIQHLVIVSVNRKKYSETFIHKSFDAFPREKTLLYGGYLPTHFTNSIDIEGKEIPQKAKIFWQKSAQSAQEDLEKNLFHWLKSNRVDAVLAHYGPSGVAMMNICHAAKIPMIVHFHGYDAYRQDILESHGLSYAELFVKAKALVVVSRDMQRQLLKLGAPEAKIKLLHYGVNRSFWQAQAFTNSQPHFLFVGRFVPKKAPLLLIEAFQKLIRILPKARLKMIGDGELLEACKQRVMDLGLIHAIDFEGVKSPAEVREMIANSIALVLPSCLTSEGDSEGTPLVVLEAGACARAVVASRHGGIVDVISHKENGLLFNEGNEAELVNAMFQMASNLDFAAQMGINASQRIRKNFDAQNYHQKLWELFSAY